MITITMLASHAEYAVEMMESHDDTEATVVEMDIKRPQILLFADVVTSKGLEAKIREICAEYCLSESDLTVSGYVTEHWADETYPMEDWRTEVANADTILGYDEWVMHKKEAEKS